MSDEKISLSRIRAAMGDVLMSMDAVSAELAVSVLLDIAQANLEHEAAARVAASAHHAWYKRENVAAGSPEESALLERINEASLELQTARERHHAALAKVTL